MSLIFLVLAAVFIRLILRITVEIVSQQKCLSDDDIRNYILGRLFNNDAEYHRVIGHLGNCEKCQQRMLDYKPSDHIEDHLLDDKNDD